LNSPFPAGDFGLAWLAAQDLLAGRSPYARMLPVPYAPNYPATAAVFALPFTFLSAIPAAAAFIALGTCLLAYGLMRDRPLQLPMLLSFPFFLAVLQAQWSPLIVASYFLPWIGALALKPQLAIPLIAISTKRYIALISAAVLGILSLLIRPTWIWEWRAAMAFEHFFPILQNPGILLLLALMWYREKDAQLLLISAACPQRSFYDPLALLVIPRSAAETWFAVTLSWLAFPFWASGSPHGRTAMVSFQYLPILAILMWRRRNKFHIFRAYGG